MQTREFKLNNIRRYIVVSVSLLSMLLQGCASSVNVISEETFSSISTYEFGDDRNKLTEFSQLIDSLSKSEKNRALAEEDMLKFLESDATFASKQYICRELRIVGSENSVPVLSKMLMDEKTTNIAKYALENIPGSKVDEALIELLPDATKKVKLAIINTLGSRESEAAATPIGELLNSSDSEIAISAASALGKIGTKESMKYLDKYFNTDNTKLKTAILDSYLLCIDNLADQQKLEEAHSLYLKFYTVDLTINIKQATLVGIINTSSDKEKEILNRISSEPEVLKFVPISKIRDLPKNINFDKFAKLLPTLQPANQIQLLAVLKDVGDKSIKSAVLEMLNSETEEVRIAARKTLINIGDETDVIMLATTAALKSGLERSAARATLDLLKGNNIDNTIVQSISSSDNIKVKVELIRAVGARNITTAYDDMIKYTESDNNKIKSEAFKSLANISNLDNLPSLIEVLLNQKTNADRKKIERTISRVLINFPDKSNSEKLIKTYNLQSDVDMKCSFLRLLGFTNEASSLNILKNELNNNDENIKLAAIIGLSSWQTPEPLNDLKNIMLASDNPKITSAALKGFTKFIALDSSLSEDEKFELYKISLKYSKTGNEKNAALDGIRRINKFEALDILILYINQPEIEKTVNDGINGITWNLRKEDPERVKEYIIDLLEKIDNIRFHTKSDNVLKEIDIYQKQQNSK